MMDFVLYSEKAEKAVLGAMLAQPTEVVDDVISILSENDFFVPIYQRIFIAITSINGSQPIDVTTVYQYLKDHKGDEDGQTFGILAEVLNGFSSHLNVAGYIRIVREKAILRSLQKACTTIAQDLEESGDAATDILDRAQTVILGICAKESTQDSEAAGIIAQREADAILNYNSKQPLRGLPSGLAKLDQLTTGWNPEELIVVAARPGGGKSALGLLFADSVARMQWNESSQSMVEPGHAVGMFDLEMSRSQKVLRLISMRSGIPLTYLRRRSLHEMQQSELRFAVHQINNQIHIDDSSPLNITQLRSRARRMVAKFGIKMIVVDYLQLLKGTSKQSSNRFHEVGEVSRGIKSLAKELKIPIIALAQLNRKNEESNSEPKLHHLRESGDIEQEADVVILLHFPDPDNKTKCDLIIAKQRNGPTDVIPITFDPATTLFKS